MQVRAWIQLSSSYTCFHTVSTFKTWVALVFLGLFAVSFLFLQFSSQVSSLTWLVEGGRELFGHQSGDAGLAVGGLRGLFSCLRLGFRMGRPAGDRCDTVYKSLELQHHADFYLNVSGMSCNLNEVILLEIVFVLCLILCCKIIQCKFKRRVWHLLIYFFTKN